MSANPFLTAVVGAFHELAHTTYLGWILLCIIAVAIGSVIAFRDGGRVQRAEEQARIELLRR